MRPGTAAMAPGQPPRLDALLAFCASPTLARAAETARAWGWLPADPARIAQWRAAYHRSIGVPVEGAGWQGSRDERADALGFWQQAGVGAYRACSYSTRRPNGLRAAIEARFGPPQQSHDLGAGAGVASWSAGPIDVSWSAAGDVTLVYVVTRRH